MILSRGGRPPADYRGSRASRSTKARAARRAQARRSPQNLTRLKTLFSSGKAVRVTQAPVREARARRLRDGCVMGEVVRSAVAIRRQREDRINARSLASPRARAAPQKQCRGRIGFRIACPGGGESKATGARERCSCEMDITGRQPQSEFNREQIARLPARGEEVRAEMAALETRHEPAGQPGRAASTAVRKKDREGSGTARSSRNTERNGASRGGSRW